METEQLVCTNFSVSNSFICVVSQINVIFAQQRYDTEWFAVNSSRIQTSVRVKGDHRNNYEGSSRLAGKRGA